MGCGLLPCCGNGVQTAGYGQQRRHGMRRIEIPLTRDEDCWDVQAVRSVVTSGAQQRREVTSWVFLLRGAQIGRIRVDWDGSQPPAIVALLTRAWLELMPVRLVDIDQPPDDEATGEGPAGDGVACGEVSPPG